MLNEAQTDESLTKLGHLEFLTFRTADAAALAVDVWKIASRASGDQAMPRIIAACDRAIDRLGRLGFEFAEFAAGIPYDSNSTVTVLQHEGGDGPAFVSECLSPAVFYKKLLIRNAEIITKETEELT